MTCPRSHRESGMKLKPNPGCRTPSPVGPLSQSPRPITATWALMKGKRLGGNAALPRWLWGETVWRKGKTYNPKPAFSRKGCFQLSWGREEALPFGCKSSWLSALLGRGDIPHSSPVVTGVPFSPQTGSPQSNLC